MAAEVTSNEQGQFWAYHDKLYSAAAQASPESLTLFASEIGLDLAPFKNCLASGKYNVAVQKDIEDGVKAGVTGTPTFLNGRPIAGAQPLQRFVEVIEEELAHRSER
jgi:protein-disulfide isomerase